jgi:hypothetical protein
VECIKQIDMYKSPVSHVTIFASVVKAIDLTAGTEITRSQAQSLGG